MIKISQQEFETKIQDIIDGKTTRVKLIEELKVDRVTLNTKIQELAVYNPELYRAFVIKFPYRPKEYTHIDYEAVIIDILKNGYKRREWKDIYGIDSKTINRKMHDVEVTNPMLMALYREVSDYRKRQMPLPQDLLDRIDSFVPKEIFLGDVCDNKRNELIEKEKEYNEARMSGMGAEEASKKVGQGRISKAIDTLSRIELERRIMSNNPNKEEDEGER